MAESEIRYHYDPELTDFLEKQVSVSQLSKLAGMQHTAYAYLRKKYPFAYQGLLLNVVLHLNPLAALKALGESKKRFLKELYDDVEPEQGEEASTGEEVD